MLKLYPRRSEMGRHTAPSARPSLPIKAQQSQPLLDHPSQEEGIADEMALPETTGFDDEPPQPLETKVGRPAGCSAQLAESREATR